MFVESLILGLTLTKKYDIIKNMSEQLSFVNNLNEAHLYPSRDQAFAFEAIDVEINQEGVAEVTLQLIPEIAIRQNGDGNNVYEIYYTYQENQNVCGASINSRQVRRSTGMIFNSLDDAKKYLKFRKKSVALESQETRKNKPTDQITTQNTKAGDRVNTSLSNLAPLDALDFLETSKDHTNRVIITSNSENKREDFSLEGIYSYHDQRGMASRLASIVELQNEIKLLQEKQSGLNPLQKLFQGLDIKAQIKEIQDKINEIKSELAD